MAKTIEKIYAEIPNAQMGQEAALIALETIYAITETRSQNELAALLGTTQSTIATWVKRGGIPSDVIVWLAVKYNAHPDYIVGNLVKNPWETPHRERFASKVVL